MATVLDAGIVGYFAPLFVFLFIFVVLYGIMLRAQIFGDKQGLYALISGALAFMTLFIPNIARFVGALAPLLVGVVILGFMILLVLSIVGFKGDMMEGLVTHPGVFWTVMVLCILIVVFAFSQTMMTEDVSEDTSIRDVLFHEKILGVILIFVIAGFAVNFLSMTAT